jgi:quercetin dioxygenase-like cupin family protein
MNEMEFDEALKRDGYTEIQTKTLAARPPNTEHGHDYAVRGLVLEGTFIVSQNGQATTYRQGDIFSVAAGCEHTEEIGAEGARVLIGLKY